MAEEKDKIGAFLVKAGLITEKQLDETLEFQKRSGKRLGGILIEKGLVSEKQIIKALAHQFGLEWVRLSSYPIDTSLLHIFPSEKMQQWRIFPIKLEKNNLIVAVTNPLDIVMLQELKYLSGYRIRPVLATSIDIDECINKYFGSHRNVQEAIQEIVTSKKEETLTEEMSLKDLEVAVREAPVVKLVNSVMGEAIKEEASDVHFEPQREKLRVRYRVDGMLYEKFTIPKGLQPPVVSRIKIMSGMDIAERRRPQDGRMSLFLGDIEYDIRVSTLPDVFGEKVVLRILDKKSILITLGNLGLDNDELSILNNLISRPYGIILVTGPTGSGKTTTLYSILNKINDATRNITTIEEPIEYELEGINQTAVNVRGGYTFATGMRHILRQDPDVIMIGEIRDLETAEIAIQAALTGHLVFSTLHTNNAPGAIIRLLDMDVEPFLISSSVIGVIAQRLVRKICPYCAQEYYIPQELAEEILEYLPNAKEIKFVKPVGCDKCRHIGYHKRTGIFEIMRVTSEIKDLVLKRAMEREVTEEAIKQGMRTLQRSALEKAYSKITSLEEVMRVTFVKEV